MKKLVSDLGIGDKTKWWQVIGEPWETTDDKERVMIVVPVRFNDGGTDERLFTPATELEVVE